MLLLSEILLLLLLLMVLLLLWMTIEILMLTLKLPLSYFSSLILLLLMIRIRLSHSRSICLWRSSMASSVNIAVVKSGISRSIGMDISSIGSVVGAMAIHGSTTAISNTLLWLSGTLKTTVRRTRGWIASRTVTCHDDGI